MLMAVNATRSSCSYRHELITYSVTNVTILITLLYYFVTAFNCEFCYDIILCRFGASLVPCTSIWSALSDISLLHLPQALRQQGGKWRSRRVIVDFAVLHVIDSFAARALRVVAHRIRLRAVETVIGGILAEAARSIVQLGLMLEADSHGTRPRRGPCLTNSKGSERLTMGSAVVAGEVRLPVKGDADILTARRLGRALGAEIGFSPSDLTLIATVISELTRNIVLYAGRGEIAMRVVEQDNKRSLVVTARDDGPGIPDVARALQDGYSTSGGLGLGLPGVRRLVDEFEVVSEVGRGTTVTAKKWKR